MNPRDEKDHLNYSKLPRINTPSSSRQCLSSFKNPRIVRVSRTLGGKDRHSKVCTVRGLRDRRIRLSVPTAIQLYDLQHRLGLSQPSKVVQWLIEATKHEIDKLPPLPILVPSNYYQESSSHSLSEKNKWVESQQEEENGGGFGGFVGQLSAHNFLPISSTQFSVSNMPYNFHWDQQNFSYMTADEQSLSYHPYLCPSAPAMASFTPTFPSYIHQSMESVQQNSVFPTTLHFICPSKAVQSPENGNGKPEKDKDIV